jgi:hypothetical protein
MSIIKTTLQTLVAAIARAAEVTANKLTAWQSVPDDTHFPSEKLVKDSLDAKIESDPPQEACTITNLYIENGNLNVEYEDVPIS